MKLVALLLLLFSEVSYAVNMSVDTYIPEKAYLYIPTLKNEINVYWKDHPDPAYFAALIEHESCISLNHPRCWSPTSQLLTSREEGAGLIQITRTYKKDGSIRFDSLSELVNLHKDNLSELSWKNIYTRPDLQLRAIVLKSKDDSKKFITVPNPIERIKFIDASYNQGAGRTMNERKLCGLKANCNPQLWDNNVEKQCTANAIIYDTRTGCDISRFHVKDTTETRIIKYRKLF
jgi:hypothetical protein